MPASAPAPEYPRVVIVGAGFGGLACASNLGGTSIPVTVVDRKNYNLFVPLLYQVATAALSPGDIAEPIRKILSRYPNIDVVLGDVTGVNPAQHTVVLANGNLLHYGRLVIATGSVHSYFGHDEWAGHAPGLKSIEDALSIRARVLMSFEEAEMCSDPERQKALMTTVIVGGGPTGVEMAGAIAELARYALARDFRRIDPRAANILLVEAGPRILPGFPEELSRYAHAALERLGVTVVVGEKVMAIEAGVAVLSDRRVAAGTIIWGAGVQASSLGSLLGIETDGAGRIRVAADLSVPGLDGVYALGDTALMFGEEGDPMPALAQVAKQQGKHLGKALAANILRNEPMPPFRFRDRGNTAVIGRNSAVFDFGTWKLKGWFAWLLWSIVHVVLLVGFENRLLVTMQWLWRFVSYERGARLITMGTAESSPVSQNRLLAREARGHDRG